ncbi:MAG: hypothetical protein ABEJ07_01200 [Candidatus Nanohaloarchaea archaeon]
MELDGKQALGIIGVTTALFGLLVFPLAVQHYTGTSAVKVTFGIIVLYAALSWWMKNRR